jgi:multisubunit Na+/H+ antiporter MnhB subunit
MKPSRRPVLGFFAGVFLGIGVALLLFVFGVVPMTVMWLGIVTLACAILGIVVAYVAPARGGKAPAPSG